MKHVTILILASIIFAGCSNNYRQFETREEYIEGVRTVVTFDPKTGKAVWGSRSMSKN